MEKIVAAGGKGVIVKNDDYVAALLCLQKILLFEKINGTKFPGHEFGAAVVTCSPKEQRKAKKRMRKVRSWVNFFPISENESIVLAPSLNLLDLKMRRITKEDVAGCMERYREAKE